MMKLAVVGATGLVGQEMIEVLEERRIEVDAFIPVASSRSLGRTVSYNGKSYPVRSIEDALSMNPDYALFSAGGDTSRAFAQKFAQAGTTVIDNSSAWRMHDDIKLIVPEVNGHILSRADRIIANPNCSTIQLVVALNPLHQAYGIRRLVISTYQSFTGTGASAVSQYESEKQGEYMEYPMAYNYPIFENCIPHCDVFMDNDYTREEMKLVDETRKIMAAPDIAITATAVRVPVHGGHSESVNVEFNKAFEMDALRDILSNSPGIVMQDQISDNVYPMPLNARKKDEVFVGRLRRDHSIDKGINMWIVADNLRKGAATNAVQILQVLLAT